MEKLELCIKDVFVWCNSNGLACNQDKTEVVHLSSRFSPNNDISALNINGLNIAPKETARNLGFLIDNHLVMKKHVNNICKNAYLSIRNIGKIRNHLDNDTCKKLIHAFVTSKIDSCNSLLAGLPDIEINKLQSVQNTAARIVTRTKKDDSITRTLEQLHWLPVKARIDFKILTLVYKALHDLAPSYLSEIISPYKPSRLLRSAGKNLLEVPKSNTKSYGDRSFAIYGPKLWNSIPTELRTCPSLQTFKTKLKTYLFCKYFKH